MKKFLKFFGILGVVFAAPLAFAKRGGSFDFDPHHMMIEHGGRQDGSTALSILVGILMVAAFVFWVSMLLRAIKKEEKENKIVWVVVIVFAQIIGALIYYFAEVFDNSSFKTSKKSKEIQDSKTEDSE